VTGTGSSTLTVNHDRSTPVGTFDIDGQGRKRECDAYNDGKFGGECATTAAGLHDISEPKHADVIVGNATTYTASVGALNGFGGTVTLSASGLPTGATASFQPATVTGAGSSTLTVTTAGSTPVGTSTLTPTLHLHFENRRRFPLFPLLACVLMVALTMMRRSGKLSEGCPVLRLLRFF